MQQTTENTTALRAQLATDILDQLAQGYAEYGLTGHADSHPLAVAAVEEYAKHWGTGLDEDWTWPGSPEYQAAHEALATLPLLALLREFRSTCTDLPDMEEDADWSQ